MSRLIELNRLAPNSQSVYSHPDSAEKDFAYSDGSDAERYLRQVFDQAGDLGTHSEELQSFIKDWPSEYHLSPKRGNLLRPLAMPEGAKVLELGCGCGAVTRFLGDHGMAVDAIEGSEIRADLAKRRCRGLDDVDIIQANFNRIELPANEYDYALLIGVSEYARRFSPDSKSDADAVVDILNRIRPSLKPGGRLVIAIENRTGMKYLHGAHEDHYSLRFVGIDNYQDSAGIRTYTRGEWRELAEQSGFTRQSFWLPFPDYKIPTVMLTERYAETDKNAWCHLEGIHSDDYTFLFDPHIPEALTWQGYNAAGVLPDLANSFLITLSVDGDHSDIEALDFSHQPDFRRRREFCTVIEKQRDSNSVVRKSLTQEDEPDLEPYLKGRLLSADWARSLLIYGDPTRFFTLLKKYLAFVSEQADQDGNLPIDLLPNNIVVDDSGGYRIFDQEWSEGCDSGFLLFRALLTLANHYRPGLRQYCRRRRLYDVEAFLRHSFQGAGINRLDFADYCKREDEFQNRVLVGRDADTQGVLGTPLMETPVNAHATPRLYWRFESGGFDDGNSVGMDVEASDELSRVRFYLPEAQSGVEALRFDPFDQHRPFGMGAVEIESIRVIELNAGTAEERCCWSIEGRSLIQKKARIQDLTSLDESDMLIATGDDPALIFELSGFNSAEHSIHAVDVQLCFISSVDYARLRHSALERLSAAETKIAQLENRLKSATRAETDLARIRASKSWRLLNRLHRLLR